MWTQDGNIWRYQDARGRAEVAPRHKHGHAFQAMAHATETQAGGITSAGLEDAKQEALAALADLAQGEG